MAAEQPQAPARTTDVPDGGAKDEMVVIGRVGRPHGVRGEVRFIAHNPDSTLWKKGMSVTWRKAGKRDRQLQLTTMRPTPKGLLVRIEGIGDRDEVGKLVHGDLAVPRDLRPPPDAGEYYHVDVIGSVVYDADSGDRLGTVRHIGQTNVDLLEIRLDGGGNVTVPVLADYVLSIGEQPGRVEIRNLHHWKD